MVRLDRTMPGQQAIGGKLRNRVDRARPLARVSVVNVRQETDDRIAGGDGSLLRTKDHDVAGGVGPAVKLDVEVVGAVLNDIRV